ncbi:hypothetical protein [Hydrocarboniphaga effusa]|uniref:hypothetical protein n=1 Tax=Hydrocarboniphaga effusa TaxID=243629 RepID=UPI00398BF211
MNLRRNRFALAFGAFVLSAGSAQAAANFYKPGDDNDPRIRSARFLGEDKRHMSASVELLRVQAEAGRSSDVQFPWLLADNYLSFGLRERADAIYEALSQGTSDPLQLARAQLKEARFEYTRGYLPESRARLLRIREGLPKELLIEWQDLLAKVLLEQGRNADAVEVLTAPKNGDDQSEYTRYNLGVGLLREKRAEQGHTVLDRVGKLAPSDRDTLALADKANLTLGWDFLQNQQAAAAKPILQRVRVEGPFSNRALLGLGWAELLPNGERAKRVDLEDGSSDKQRDPFASFSTLGVLLRRGQVDDDSMRKRHFRRSLGSSDQAEAMDRALSVWLLLIDRDPQDPAVQESWLAVPYALDQVGAHEQARSYYEQAIERLEAARERTDKALAAIRSNRMIDTIIKREVDAESGWNWELKDLPDAPETYYLQTMLAEHRFAEALKNYRDARLLQRNLEAWEKRLTDVEKGYFTGASRGTVDTGILFSRAKENRTELRSGVNIKLATEINLAEPGRYDRAVVMPPLRAPELKLANPPDPQVFRGTFEQVGDLRKRLDSLKPALIKMGDEQGRLLQEMASTELKSQKTLIEKYLVEARFALARLYDRPLGSVDEPDEYEIKK